MEKVEKVGAVLRQRLVQSVKTGLAENNSVFVVKYSQLSSSQLDGFRKSVSKIGANVHVAKNRLARLALEDADQKDLAQAIEGQTAFIWGNEDSVTLAKAIMDFVKDSGDEKVEVKGGILDKAFLKSTDVKKLAELPAKEVLQAQLLQIMLAPLTRFAGCLNAKSRDLLSILKQLSEKKEGGK